MSLSQPVTATLNSLSLPPELCLSSRSFQQTMPAIGQQHSKSFKKTAQFSMLIGQSRITLLNILSVCTDKKSIVFNSASGQVALNSP